ncbi:cation:proton antiporter [Streptacidiphilus sp. P02-A3a]|uniref:cation:proton antiporter n=1 Tax=Streptacidiphilus sp. P02-A3a TaxID=2704468 RepID=UPI0015F9D6F7|nr:cation:proton antiporter [Streptacidiphilus sp. P02-A3a]QMU70013.1 cation:proton antiporter [Streptacidiphilus sp. P02-A3a]
MSFTTLAVISLAALLGPLLALPRNWHLPVVLGELLAGIVLGPTVVGYLHAGDATFTFLADIGFALIMFVAGAHVPVRDANLRAGLRVGTLRAAAVGVLAVGPAFALARGFGTGHTALYTVLIASSSAALILPMIDSLAVGGGPVLEMLPQVAVADTACIVALPLVIDPAHAARAALGALAVIGCALVLFVVLRRLERGGYRRRLHRLSEHRRFALELRISLAILFALADLAARTHVSIMLAGFSFGLVVAAIGEPRRLAKQLFALTEGFLGPLFFLWLGASLDLRALGRHPSFVLLGLLLGAGAVAVHAAMRAAGQPLAIGVLACAQLGVPVAAATLGNQLNLLRPGEAAALMLGAVVTIAASTAAGAVAARASASAAATADPPR